MRGRRLLAAASVLAALIALPATLAPASAPNVRWTELLPALPGAADRQPGPVPHCREPSLDCIQTELERLRALRDRLGCDHRAVFATTYLTLTREIKGAVVHGPEVFDDLDYLFVEDALFADVYLRTLRAWERGEDVPDAWQIALHATAEGDLNGGQDMLLGINAHVQNDMPYVLAALGLREPDGGSRKPDHDRVNGILNRAYEPVVTAIGRRYDPLVTTATPGWSPVDDVAGLEVVRSWREGVWRNAERLLDADSSAERQAVAAQIEANAAAWARAMATPQQPGYRAQRDAYCEARLGR